MRDKKIKNPAKLKVESPVKQESRAVHFFVAAWLGNEEWPSRGSSPLQPPNGLSSVRRARYVI